MVPGYPQTAVQSYLLSILAGGSTNPATVGALAIQFSGLTQQALQNIWTTLAVTWANSGVFPGYLTDDQGSYILTDTGEKIIIQL